MTENNDYDEAKARLATLRLRAMRGEDLDEEELREVILALREGRRSASSAQSAKRTKAPTISVSQLFGTRGA
jgi:hypothetical protein